MFVKNAYAGNPEMQEQITMAVERAIPAEIPPEPAWYTQFFEWMGNTHPTVQAIAIIVIGYVVLQLGRLFLRSKYSNFIPGVKKSK